MDFFLKGVGVSPIPKGCYHKKMGIFGYFRQKGGSHPIHRDFIIKNWEYFGIFRQFQNFLIRKNWGLQIAGRGRGGLRISEFFRKKNSFFLLMPPLIPKTIYSLGCFTKTCFMKTVWSTCSASIWGLHWRNPKGFLNLACFRGFKSNFGFDLFYNVDIHSALTSQVSVWQSEGWVKIYSVKKVKTEMTCAPSKTYQNQKSFWIPWKQPPNTCRAGWANFFHQKYVFVRHPIMHACIWDC